MRLIDADALMKRLKGVLAMVENEPNQTYANAIRGTIRDVALAHTIDAEPVKHGEFTTLDEVNTFVTALPKRCETCGTEFILLFRKSEPNQGMFCPMCGARRRDERA